MRWLAGVTALLIVAYLCLVAVRSAIAYQDIIEAKDLLEGVEATLAEAGLDVTSDELDEAEARLERARGKLSSARGFLNRDPALRVTRRIPWIGEQVNAVRDLTQSGLDGVDIGLSGTLALRQLIGLRDGDAYPVGEKAFRFLDGIEPDISRIEELLLEVERRQAALRSRSLLGPLSSAADQIDRKVTRLKDLVESYRHAKVVIPAFLGRDRPMRYLVLGQDNTEIFPTGGIIGAYGVVTLDDGRLTDTFFEGTEEQVDRWQEQTGGEYVEPPAPLKRYLLRKVSWSLGTANWSPDFPDAAQQAEFFYLKGGGEPVDGVIAIDFTAMERLLALLGPLELPEYEAVIRSESVIEAILEKTLPPGLQGKPDKTFAAAVAQAIIHETFAVETDLWGALMETVAQLGRERHFLIFLKEDRVQSHVREIGWAGEVRSYEGDYLMIVDSSIHSTKLNLILEQEFALEIDLQVDGSARHQVTVHDRNPLGEWAIGRDPELVKAWMPTGRYGSFLRLLVPLDSVLADVRVGGSSGVDFVEQLSGRRSFGRHFHVARDESVTAVFEYRVPNVVTSRSAENEYRLLIQKQAGIREIPIEIDMRLPEGAEVVRATMNGQEVAGDLTNVEVILTEDIEFVVSYR